MGETDFSTAEENPQETEPPLGAQHGASTHQHQHQPAQPVSRDDGDDAPLTAWHCQTAAQVAQTLDVDIRYRLTFVDTTYNPLILLLAMVSASSKRNLAFSSMGLTRLKELKGYPCGRFS
jgi:hypothetical protein